MNIVLYIVDRLTLVISWAVQPMFPHDSNTNTQLTYLYIVHSSNSRITPNGSLQIWCGYASKWSHPP
jgi:hypothetical protein